MSHEYSIEIECESPLGEGGFGVEMMMGEPKPVNSCQQVFFEVYIHADIVTLEKRDTKGLYAKARNGEMNNLIGYSEGPPYEPPEEADLTLDTNQSHIKEALEEITVFIRSCMQ